MQQNNTSLPAIRSLITHHPPLASSNTHLKRIVLPRLQYLQLFSLTENPRSYVQVQPCTMRAVVAHLGVMEAQQCPKRGNVQFRRATELPKTHNHSPSPSLHLSKPPRKTWLSRIKYRDSVLWSGNWVVPFALSGNCYRVTCAVLRSSLPLSRCDTGSHHGLTLTPSYILSCILPRLP